MISTGSIRSGLRPSGASLPAHNCRSGAARIGHHARVSVNEFAVERRIVSYEPGDDEPDLAPTDIAMPLIDGVPLYERLGDRYPGVAYEVVAAPSRQWL